MRISDWSSDVCSSDLDAGAVEKMGMALGRGQHPCGFAIGLAEVAVGGAGYEAAGAVAVLHAGEQIGKILGCEREIVAHRRQGAALAILVDHAIDRKSTRLNSRH